MQRSRIHQQEGLTWTPTLCRIIAFWSLVLGGLKQLFCMFLWGLDMGSAAIKTTRSMLSSGFLSTVPQCGQLQSGPAYWVGSLCGFSKEQDTIPDQRRETRLGTADLLGWPSIRHRRSQNEGRACFGCAETYPDLLTMFLPAHPEAAFLGTLPGCHPFRGSSSIFRVWACLGSVVISFSQASSFQEAPSPRLKPGDLGAVAP